MCVCVRAGEFRLWQDCANSQAGLSYDVCTKSLCADFSKIFCVSIYLITSWSSLFYTSNANGRWFNWSRDWCQEVGGILSPIRPFNSHFHDLRRCLSIHALSAARSKTSISPVNLFNSLIGNSIRTVSNFNAFPSLLQRRRRPYIIAVFKLVMSTKGGLSRLAQKTLYLAIELQPL